MLVLGYMGDSWSPCAPAHVCVYFQFLTFGIVHKLQACCQGCCPDSELQTNTQDIANPAQLAMLKVEPFNPKPK